MIINATNDNVTFNLTFNDLSDEIKLELLKYLNTYMSIEDIESRTIEINIKDIKNSIENKDENIKKDKKIVDECIVDECKEYRNKLKKELDDKEINKIHEYLNELEHTLNYLENEDEDDDCISCDCYKKCNGLYGNSLDRSDIKILCRYDDIDVCNIIDELTDQSIATCGETVELLNRYNIPFEIMIRSSYNHGYDVICEYYTLDRYEITRSSDGMEGEHS